MRLVPWSAASGEIWAKLDALSPGQMEKLWRTHMTPASHLARIWGFAKEHPLGIQTMVMTGAGLVSVETLARQLAAAVSWGLTLGARIMGIHLVSPARPLGNPDAARGLTPATLQELQVAAHILRAETSVPVSVFA